ncbi:MAG: hypothetical protein RLZZ484_1572, partial [Pseudomonadota bacterium]
MPRKSPLRKTHMAAVLGLPQGDPIA